MATLLPTRSIGPFTVSALGLGCMGLSSGYGPPVTQDHGVRLLNHALDAGVTFFDTAALYGMGDNERLLGRALMHRRAEFTLASKCVLSVVDGKRAVDGRPDAVLATLDGALGRLGADHIDLYYLHRLDPKVPVEETVGALARACEAGKIGAIGLSEMSAATIRRANAVHPIAAVQNEYSPAVRNPEMGVLDTCRDLGIAFVAFSPVGRAMLAGVALDGHYAPDDIRANLPRFLPPRLAANMTIVARFNALAEDAGMTPAQLSIAWLLSRGDHVVPIPGTTSIAHLDENIAALRLDAPADLLARVDALFPPGALVGARYAASMQAMVDTELLPDEELA